MTYFSGRIFGFEARPESLQRQASDLVEKITINNSKSAGVGYLLGEAVEHSSHVVLPNWVALGMTIRITEELLNNVRIRQKLFAQRLTAVGLSQTWLLAVRERLLLASCLR